MLCKETLQIHRLQQNSNTNAVKNIEHLLIGQHQTAVTVYHGKYTYSWKPDISRHTYSFAHTELQVKGCIDDNSKIIFLVSQGKYDETVLMMD